MPPPTPLRPRLIRHRPPPGGWTFETLGGPALNATLLAAAQAAADAGDLQARDAVREVFAAHDELAAIAADLWDGEASD